MFKSIQACRAVAALFVVLHHLGGALASPKYFGVASFGKIFHSGDSGVAFFFVLSGFIISWVHTSDFGHPQRLGGYLRKRAVRIYPTYCIVFAITYGLALAYPASRAASFLDPVTLIKSLALIPQDAALIGGTGAPVLIVAWTLQYEICFYALVGLLILSRLLGSAALLLVAANLAACHMGSCTFPRSFFANNLFVLFGVGMLVAYGARSSLRLPRPGLIAASATIAFLSFAVMETIMGDGVFGVDRRLVYGGLSAALILALAQGERDGQLTIRNRWIPLLGDSSYALYLIHFPLISGLCKATRWIGLHGMPGAIVAFFLILACCLLVAIGFFLLVERPILRALSARSPARKETLPQGYVQTSSG